MAMKEQAHHSEAFERYYAMGKDRSFRKLQHEVGVSLTSVNKWAQEFDWSERIQQRDMKVAREMERKTIATVVNQKANYRKVIHQMFANMIAEMQKKDDKGRPTGVFPKIETVKEFAELVKLDMLLMGENTEHIRHEGDVEPTKPITDVEDWLRGDPDARNTIRELWRRRVNHDAGSDGGTSPQ